MFFSLKHYFRTRPARAFVLLTSLLIASLNFPSPTQAQDFSASCDTVVLSNSGGDVTLEWHASVDPRTQDIDYVQGDLYLTFPYPPGGYVQIDSNNSDGDVDSIVTLTGLQTGSYSTNLLVTSRIYNGIGPTCTYTLNWQVNNPGGSNPPDYVEPVTVNVTSNLPSSWNVTGPDVNSQHLNTQNSSDIGTSGNYTVFPSQIDCYALSVSPSATQNLSPGETKTFTLTYTDNGACEAPEGGGEPPPPPPPPPPPTTCTDNSTAVFTQALPSTLTAGQTYPFTILVTNTGDTWWYHGSIYQFRQISNLSISPIYGHLPTSLYPNNNTDWTFTLTAPTQPGTYDLYMSMIHTIYAGGGYLKPDGSECPGPATDTLFGQTAHKQFTVVGSNKTLTTSIASGTGTITATGISCPGDCTESYADGTVVTLTATPGSGYAFSNWTGDCAGQGTSCTLTMNANKTTAVNFAASTSQIPDITAESPLPGATIAGVINISGWMLDNKTFAESALKWGEIWVRQPPSTGTWRFVRSLKFGSANSTWPTAVSRPDVCATYSGIADCPYVGFTYSWNSQNFFLNSGAGPYSFTDGPAEVRMYAHDGNDQERWYDYTINISNTGSFDYSLSNSGTSSVNKTSSDAFTTNTIAKSLISGTSQAVTLSVSGLPSGVSVESISNQGCSPGCSSVLTLRVSPTTPSGNYSITVTGAPLSRTTSFTLSVHSGGLTVSCSASPTNVLIGQTVTWTASVSGGTTPYTYAWSGTEIPTSPVPSTNPYSIAYSTIGSKTASVTVTDADSTVTSCPANVTVNVNFDPNIEEF